MPNKCQIGRKDDQGKLRYDLIPTVSLKELAAVLTDGAIKYSDDNWQQVPDAHQRYIAAAMRHIEAYRGGQILDQDDGLHHLAHAACCLFFIIWFDNKPMEPESLPEHIDPHGVIE